MNTLTVLVVREYLVVLIAAVIGLFLAVRLKWGIRFLRLARPRPGEPGR